MNSTSGDGGDLNFHPIACFNCRSSHKQCEKQLPSCSRCISRGVTCEYKPPKRKAKSSANNLEFQSPSTKQKLEQIVENKDEPADTSIVARYPKQFSKKQVIDLYYIILCDHYVIVEKQLLEKYILNEESGEQSLKKEMNAFFYAIQALLEQRFGFCEMSEKSSRKSRDLLSKIFDHVISNYYVACTYTNLGIYEIGTGRTKLAKFYFKTAKFYFDGMDIEKLTNAEQLLHRLLSVMSFMISDDFGTNSMFSDFPNYFLKTTNSTIPTKYLEIFSKQVDLSNLELYLSTICSCFKEFYSLKAQSTRSQFDLVWYNTGMKYYFDIVFEGLKLQFLVQHHPDHKEDIENSARKLTLFSESEYFPFVTFAVIPYFTLASRVHVQIAKEIEKGLNTSSSTDCYSMILKDYRCLNVLKSRYKRVNILASTLFLEMEEILKNRGIETATTNDMSSTCNSHFPSFLDCFLNMDDSFSSFTDLFSTQTDSLQDKI